MNEQYGGTNSSGQSTGVPGRSDYDGPLPTDAALADGNSGHTVATVSATSSVGTTGTIFTNQDINGILAGVKWTGTSITYSFPTASSQYGTGYGNGAGQYPDQAPFDNFGTLTNDQKGVVRYALGLVSQYTNLTFSEITETNSTHATLRLADSDAPSTSYAYYPAETVYGGDVFYGNIRYDTPTKAGYEFDTIMHEIGHALGLKHGQDSTPTYGTLPANHDSTEWSIMDYHSFVGGDLYYRNNEGSGNQTYMIDDISALQYMYGANFNTNSGNTVYTWSPTTGEMSINGVGQGASSQNKVYEAIWDGNGTDTYDLHNYTTNLNVDLRPGYWSIFDPAQLADIYNGDVDGTTRHPVGEVANANLYNNDVRSLIENAIGGSGADTITGNQANNTLTGNGGNDTLSGGDGNDVLDGGAGNDTLDGGAGSDFASYVDATSAVTVSLAITTAQNTGGAGTDTLTGIEKLDGSAYNDVLTGDTGANALYGENGNDILDGGAGNDTLDGGAGSDFASYVNATSAVTVSLAITTAQNTGGAGTDTLTGIEKLDGSAYNDTLTGDTGANALYGENGNDTLNGGAGSDGLYGGAGNDILDGGAGDDLLSGGAGSDFAVYGDATSAVTVSLAITTAQNTGGAGTDTLSGIEKLDGSNYNDIFTGDAGTNTLYGENGNDTLNGAGGADALYGGAGNDVLDGGAGDDLLNGGAGSDFAVYGDATSGVTVSLAITTAQNTGGAGTDTLTAIEKLDGSNYNDVLTGDGSTNALFGEGGNDTLNGGAGNDSLYGGDGNDILDGGAGDDLLTGSGGVDFAVYGDATSGVTVSLAITTAQNTGGAGTDTLSGIEKLDGSTYNDVLTGDGGTNALYGENGNDTLNGGAGADSLYGGAGNDSLTGGAGQDLLQGGVGNDSFVFTALADSTAAAPDTISDFTSGQDRIDLHLIDADTSTGGDQAFHLGATGGHTGDIVVSAYDAVHDRTTISLYVNADATADAVIYLTGDHHGLAAGDFTL